MKVYELMNKLSEFKAGSIVRIRMLKDLEEMPVFDEENGLREIDFEVQEAEEIDDVVNIDGYSK